MTYPVSHGAVVGYSIPVYQPGCRWAVFRESCAVRGVLCGNPFGLLQKINSKTWLLSRKAHQTGFKHTGSMWMYSIFCQLGRFRAQGATGALPEAQLPCS